MAAPDARMRAEAEQWFLDRGLPSVLRPGALVGRVWSRSAPTLAGFAVNVFFGLLFTADRKSPADLYGESDLTVIPAGNVSTVEMMS